MSKKSGIQRALDLHNGSPSALAAAIGGDVSRQNVEYWLSQGRVPDSKCPLVSLATGIPVEELNPLHDWTVVRRALDLKAA